ncbi:TetR/AcrR family transcriptional regulator [Rossellomorea sp. GCM10028870]|uniref:TetR/AcrR family transcriptional regulator n=1 Tax=Rossellomorea sp. GCM10028870 TaxID=3273426 RepID=UPI003618D055
MNKGKKTRTHIIEKSSVLFNKTGYKMTSISDIMEATGLKKGGIYNHFDNKDTLAKESFSHSKNVLKEKYYEAVGAKGTAYEQLDAFISIFCSLYEDNIVVGGCPLMNAAIEADDSKVDFEDSIKEGFAGLLKLIQSIIEYGKKHEEIDNRLDDKQLAIFILSSLEGSLALSRLFQDKSYLDSVIKQIRSTLFQ